jgi:glycosyltransferase involved in cell wall biosynthesis
MVYSRSDALIATTALMRDALRMRYPRVPEVALVYNWVDETVFGKSPRATIEELLPFAEGRLVAMYAGTLGHAQSPMHWMHVARSLMHRDDLMFVFVGSGPLESRMQSFCEHHQLGNVYLMGQRPVAESAALIAESDIQLVSLHDSPLLDYTLPSKVQACMASGVPIISVARGETARVIQESGCGINHEQFDTHDVASSIERLMDTTAEARKLLGLSGRRYYDEHMSRSVGLQCMTRVLTSLGPA